MLSLVPFFGIVEDMPFIYGLRDPRDWTIRYIGRAAIPQNRYNIHLRHGAPKIKRWVSELRYCSLSPDLVVIEECPFGQQYRMREHYWIQVYQRDGELLNTMPALSPEEIIYLHLSP